jgi:hypothetical protein
MSVTADTCISIRDLPLENFFPDRIGHLLHNGDLCSFRITNVFEVVSYTSGNVINTFVSISIDINVKKDLERKTFFDKIRIRQPYEINTITFNIEPQMFSPDFYPTYFPANVFDLAELNPSIENAVEIKKNISGLLKFKNKIYSEEEFRFLKDKRIF